ncbi:MAG: hypothetical protein P4M08_12040 [Oligoflexia bacterium]|nr:hypothetical protein [Oligoflexia bacterium]
MKNRMILAVLALVSASAPALAVTNDTGVVELRARGPQNTATITTEIVIKGVAAKTLYDNLDADEVPSADGSPYADKSVSGMVCTQSLVDPMHCECSIVVNSKTGVQK